MPLGRKFRALKIWCAPPAAMLGSSHNLVGLAGKPRACMPFLPPGLPRRFVMRMYGAQGLREFLRNR